MLPRLLISNDDFIRTTEERHKKVVREILQRLFDKGDIYQGQYRGFYSTRQEQFLQEKDRNPDGSWPEIYGEVSEIVEPNYFFKLKAYQPWLVDFLAKNEGFVFPRFRQKQVTEFLKEPLNDLCISRPRERLEWGIPLPFDEAFVTYVWFDALVNYYSAVAAKPGVWPADVARDRQGHPRPAARGLLAHHAPRRRDRAAQGDPGARLVADERVEDVEEQGQRAQPAGPGRRVRRRLPAVLPHPRDERRAGRRLLPGALPHALQQRPGERPRQPRQPRPQHDEPLRGRAPCPPATCRPTPRRSFAPSGRRRPGNIVPLFEQFQFHTALERLFAFIRSINAYIEKRAPWKLGKSAEAADQALLRTSLATMAEALRLACGGAKARDARGDRQDQRRPWATRRRASWREELAWGARLTGSKVALALVLFPRPRSGRQGPVTILPIDPIANSSPEALRGFLSECRDTAAGGRAPDACQHHDSGGEPRPPRGPRVHLRAGREALLCRAAVGGLGHRGGRGRALVRGLGARPLRRLPGIHRQGPRGHDRGRGPGCRLRGAPFLLGLHLPRHGRRG